MFSHSGAKPVIIKAKTKSTATKCYKAFKTIKPTSFLWALDMYTCILYAINNRRVIFEDPCCHWAHQWYWWAVLELLLWQLTHTLWRLLPYLLSWRPLKETASEKSHRYHRQTQTSNEMIIMTAMMPEYITLLVVVLWFACQMWRPFPLRAAGPACCQERRCNVAPGRQEAHLNLWTHWGTLPSVAPLSRPEICTWIISQQHTERIKKQISIYIQLRFSRLL